MRGGKRLTKRLSVPTLPNTKHEKFAQGLARGISADKAYVEAGYSANRGNASRMTAIESMQARVKEIKAAGAIRAEVTIQSLLDELEGARLLAESVKQPAAMVAASMGKGKVAGLIVDRQEKGKPGEFAGLNAEERRIVGESIERELSRRSLGVSGGAASKPH